MYVTLFIIVTYLFTSPLKVVAQDYFIQVPDAPPLEMVKIPAGKFLMGTPVGIGQNDEWPQREVYLPEYAISRHEITNAQFEKFLEVSGGARITKDYYNENYAGDFPVVFVSWNQAVDYCAWLSNMTGHEIRLPTEAHWEKAARGTNGNTFPWGNKAPGKMTKPPANFRYAHPHWSYIESVLPVCSLPESISPFGCFDMAGNVWEWCFDVDLNYAISTQTWEGPRSAFESYYAIVRGGCWDDFAKAVRCANRLRLYKGDASAFYGFRVVEIFPHTLK